MEKVRIPDLQFDMNYTFNTKEDFINLRVIDVLWILSIDQYTVAARSIGTQFKHYDSIIEKQPNRVSEIHEEIKTWINRYIQNDNLLWILLEKNYGQPIHVFIKELDTLIQLAEANPSFFKGEMSHEFHSIVKDFIYSGFYKSLKVGKKPSTFQFITFLEIVINLGKIYTKNSKKEYKLRYLLRDYFNLFYACFTDKQAIIPRLRDLVTLIFSEETCEIFTHYLMCYFNQEKIFEKVFPDFYQKINLNTVEIVGNIEQIPIVQEISLVENLTESQWVLIYFFMFQSVNLEIRVDVNVAEIARFIHLATGKNLTKIQNSEIYKKLLEAPNFKENRYLREDLIIIRPYVEKNGLKKILHLIDNEILMCKEEIKYENK
jgi:hypothetical protein